MRKGIAATVVVALGLTLIGVTLGTRLFTAGPAFEVLTDEFRPIMTEERLATLRADVNGLGAAAGELETGVVPSLALALGMTPEELGLFLAERFPDVARGIGALPEIVPRLSGVVGVLEAQRPNFESADAIPTTALPATTVPWLLVAAGALAALAGVALARGGRRAAAAALVLGLAFVAVPLAATLHTKTSNADDLNRALRPVYTEALIADGRESLATVEAMAAEMQAEMLPFLGGQLGLSAEQLQGFLAQGFPSLAGALGGLPAATARFEALVDTFDANLANYERLRPVSLEPILWLVLASGIGVALAGAWATLGPRRRREEAAPAAREEVA